MHPKAIPFYSSLRLPSADSSSLALRSWSLELCLNMRRTWPQNSLDTVLMFFSTIIDGDEVVVDFPFIYFFLSGAYVNIDHMANKFYSFWLDRIQL